MEATIWKGRRWSAANAYLRPAIKGGNVQVIRALARRVIIENGRATGVEVSQGGHDQGHTGNARGHPCRIVDQYARSS